jgi:N-dimethylarginine dimethylaminohydrolase
MPSIFDLPRPSLALVRQPPAKSFHQCVTEYTEQGQKPTINVQLAIQQWRNYVKQLSECVDQVIEVLVEVINF